ncbi:MAG: alpha/beta fold hydrolase [Geminicoccaceae bacterium]
MRTPGLDVEIVGRGRHLVLLHSLLADRTSFEPLAARIAGERRLVLVSLPGFGQSAPGGPSIGDHADRVAATFDDLALPPDTDVLGNGLGGFVALNLAIRHGRRFGRMVLVGSAIAFPEAGRATFRALADKVEQGGMAPVVDAAMRRMFPAPFIAASPEVVAGPAAAFRRIDPEVFASACRALATLDLSSELSGIQNPTLIVVGAEDEATPLALGQALAARLANARLLEMPGLGHCPHIQDPDAFVAAIAPFLGLGAA